MAPALHCADTQEEQTASKPAGATLTLERVDTILNKGE